MPVLGHQWAPGQKGYGQPHPITVYNGGDPTGLVQKIHWAAWGSTRAVGVGVSTYIWPGTATADNSSVSGVRIVAFHLGTCRGRPSYNAVDWYFPKYGDRFNPHRYINACTGTYVGLAPPFVHCADVAVPNGGRVAKRVEAIGMSCHSARKLISVAPVTRYVKSGGRFMQSGFRCGTQGLLNPLPALFDCRLGAREFLFEIGR